MKKFAILSILAVLILNASRMQANLASAPLTFVRRSEAAMILMKNAGIDVDFTKKAGTNYPDILDGEWYVPYMLKGLDIGLFEVEKSTGKLYPHQSITRVEFLMMLTKAFDLTTNISYKYTDISASDTHAPYAGLAWRYGLFGHSTTPQLLRPKLRITHKEASEALFILLQKEPQLQTQQGIVTPKTEEQFDEDIRQTLFKTFDVKQETIANIDAESDTEVTPLTVKNILLKLLRSRGSLADHTRNELLEAVNTVRDQYNLEPLRMNYYLEKSAQRHAKDMVDRGYFSHVTPEGRTYVDRIRNAGYLETKNPSFSLGENLAKGQLSVSEVMSDWMDSPTHRYNILRREFEEIGIGLFDDIWVQNFGRLTFD